MVFKMVVIRVEMTVIEFIMAVEKDFIPTCRVRNTSTEMVCCAETYVAYTPVFNSELSISHLIFVN